MAKRFVVVKLDEDGKEMGFALQQSPTSAQIVDEIESATLFSNKTEAKQITGNLLTFDPDSDYEVKAVNVTVTLV